MPEATTVGHGSYNVFYFPVKSTTSHAMANAQIDRLNRFGLGAYDLGFTPLYEIGRKVIMLQSKAESVDKPVTLEIAESGSLRPWNLLFGKTYNNSSDIDQDDGEPTTCEGVLLVHKLNTARTSVIESHIIWKTVPESFSLSIPANINDRLSSSIRLMGEYWAMLGNGAGKGVVEWKTASGSLLTLTSAPIERDDWPDDDDGSAVTESITGIVGKVCSVASTTGFVAGQLVKIAAHADDDVITNGTFTTNIDPWTGTNWAFSGNTALHSAGNTSPLTQIHAALVPGVSYTLTYKVSGRTAGDVTAAAGGVADTTRSTNDSFTKTLTCLSDTEITFTPSTDFDGAIDDVTLKSVSTDWETAIIDSVVLNTSITVRDTLKNAYAPSSVITRSMGTTFFVHNSTAGTWLYEGTDYIIYNTAGTVKAANISAGTDIGTTDVCVIAYGIASAAEEWTDNDADLYRVLPSYVKAVVSASSDFSSSYELLRLQGLDMSVTFRRSRIDETGSKVPVERPYDGCETRITLPGLDSDLTTFARLRNLTSTTQKVMTPEQSPAMYFRTEVYENSYKRAGDIKLCYEFPLVHQSAGEISDGANERGRKSNTLIGDTFALATAL